MFPISALSPYTSLLGFMIGFPTTVGTYYQVWRARKENREAREQRNFSRDCLEYVLEDGTMVNLVLLESLHSLPKPGDVVLLPGHGKPGESMLGYSAYRVSRLEHIYARVDARSRQDKKRRLAGQARLAKAVAHVELV